MRMRTYLRKIQQSADYNPRTWCWVDNCWRPVKNHRFLKRGKRKGWVEVELYYPENKAVILPVTSIRFADVTTDPVKSENSQKVGK